MGVLVYDIGGRDLRVQCYVLVLMEFLWIDLWFYCLNEVYIVGGYISVWW